jgi:hypothetical protein
MRTASRASDGEFMSYLIARRFSLLALVCINLIVFGACSQRDGSKPSAEGAPSTQNRSEHRNANEIGVAPTETKVDPLAMNPFPVFSKDAQSLAYPPGVDTVLYWGNGRFSVVGDIFYDEEKARPSTIAKGVSAVRYTNGVIFAQSTDGVLIIDLQDGGYQLYPDSSGIPGKYATDVESLRRTNAVGIIKIRPVPR